MSRAGGGCMHPFTPVLPQDTVREIFESVRNTSLLQQTVVTCMDTLHKDLVEEGAPSCLVLGTEHRGLYILKPDLATVGENVLRHVTLPSVPVFLAPAGTYSVLYRISVAARDGNIYTIKNGEVGGGWESELGWWVAVGWMGRGGHEQGWCRAHRCRA